MSKVLELYTVATHIQAEPRLSTDVAGIAECLGLQANPKIELQEITRFLESKINDTTLLTVR
ncbi:MAG: hypothetical protein WHX52_15425 [Anaerolineae bacterium]